MDNPNMDNMHKMQNLITICPHCNNYVIIEQLNCKIFRHGVIKSSGQQIPPHSNKEICDELYDKKLIYGCGRPFHVISINTNSNNELELISEKCDYI